jgi:hypothetical protein
MIRRVEFDAGPLDGWFGETDEAMLIVEYGECIHVYVLAELVDADTAIYRMRHSQVLPICRKRL